MAVKEKISGVDRFKQIFGTSPSKPDVTVKFEREDLRKKDEEDKERLDEFIRKRQEAEKTPIEETVKKEQKTEAQKKPEEKKQSPQRLTRSR